ncbi:hypothetical protein BJV82DRAFT_653324 [Fennellomyces sp. T-0311]|nr:hypothetical protein BJV82DRAFT_653324 [Fennellomyces sp. T-0311]
MRSRILAGFVFTTLAYTLSQAAPAHNGSPILHLTEDQVKEFKHVDPNQMEPDIAFPKNVESLYAGPDAPIDESLAGEVVANAQPDTNAVVAEEEVEVVEEDAYEEDAYEDEAVQEDEYIYEEDEAAAPAEEDDVEA